MGDLSSVPTIQDDYQDDYLEGLSTLGSSVVANLGRRIIYIYDLYRILYIYIALVLYPSVRCDPVVSNAVPLVLRGDAAIDPFLAYTLLLLLLLEDKKHNSFNSS